MSNPKEGSDRIDYQETPDITEVHAAVEREKPEPSAEVTPMPLWLTALCAVATVWAGLWLGYARPSLPPSSAIVGVGFAGWLAVEGCGRLVRRPSRR